MARTLGCLVGSMTLGAVVLEWAQPTGTASMPTGHQLVAIVRDAIEPAVRDQGAGAGWQAVLLEAQPEGSRPDAAGVHVIVRPDGQWTLTDNWRDQRHVGQAGVIRIGLTGTPGSNQATPPQWETTTRLLRCLQEMYDIADTRIITPDDLAPPRVPPVLPLTAQTGP